MVWLSGEEEIKEGVANSYRHLLLKMEIGDLVLVG